MISYGDIIRVKKDELILSEKLLEPIGIFPKSKIFGIYLPTGKEDVKKFGFEHDLLFTPIHYKVWPFVVKFTIILKHEIGTLQRASEIFLNNGINILYAECNKASHHYANWNFVGEFVEIKEKYKPLLENIFKKNNNMKNKRQKLNKIRNEIKDEIITICKNKLKKDLSDEKNILHEHTDIDSYRFHYLSSLSHFFSHQVFYEPIAAECIDKGVIKIDQRSIKEKYLGEFLRIEFPTLGFATPDLNDLSLRISIIEKKELKKFFLFELKYEKSCKKDITKFTTMGFLNVVTSAFKNININLFRIYNLTSESSISNEIGEIKGFGKVNDDSEIGTIEEIKNKLERNLEQVKLRFEHTKNINIKGLHISQIKSKSIFISMKLKSNRRNDFLHIIYSISRKFGIPDKNIILIEEYTRPISQEIINEIKNCDGLIAIFHKTSEKDYMWLVSEYAIARAYGKKAVRLIEKDLNIPLFESDTPKIEFRSDMAKDELSEIIEKAFLEILKK